LNNEGNPCDAFKIGAMLRQARETAGLSQEELAHRLKTKKTAISRIEFMQKTLNYQH
jgi:ribosome-binding protein aMBF1 (putative translation factor)